MQQSTNPSQSTKKSNNNIEIRLTIVGIFFGLVSLAAFFIALTQVGSIPIAYLAGILGGQAIGMFWIKRYCINTSQTTDHS